MAGIDISESENCEDNHSHLYFLKKTCIADSAVILNNRAVNYFNNMAKDATPATHPILREVNQLKLKTADSLFSEAIALRPNYEIAIVNKEKLNYNIGVQEYHAFLADSSDRNGLSKAISYFDKITLDSFKLDALHGKGLATYYDEYYVYKTPDDSKNIYSDIIAQDSFYFNSIETYPHLQSLLNFEKNINIKVVDADTKSPISAVNILDKKSGKNYSTNNSGEIEFKLTLGEHRAFEFSKNGYDLLNELLIDSIGKYSYQIELKKAPPAVVVEPQVNLPIGDIEFCYAYNGEIFKGYFSAKYELFENGQDFSSDESIKIVPDAQYDWIVYLDNVVWGSPKHDEELEIDLIFNGAMIEGQGIKKVTVEDRYMAAGGNAVCSFLLDANDIEDIHLPVSLFIKRKNCSINYDNNNNFQTEIENGCWLGMAFYGKIYFKLSSRIGLYIESQSIDNKNKLQDDLSTLSCTLANFIKDKKAPNTAQPLDKIFFAFKRNYNPDDDGDGVYDHLDECPGEKGAIHNNGCPETLSSEDGSWQLIKSHFVAEPKILQNRNFFDVFEYGGYEHKIILKELTRDSLAIFSIEKDIKAEARQVPIIDLKAMKKDEEQEFNLDGNSFRIIYHGQDRKRVNSLMRDITLYSIYVDEKNTPDPFNINPLNPSLDGLLKELEANMVFVEGGTFQMGCDPERDGECEEKELPLHDVTLSDFYIGKYEVTQELWRAVMGSDPEELRFKGCDKCPVERVSWDDIQGFLQKLNELTGQRYRLPTEAEWEYAARGGDKKERFAYSGSNDIDKVAWYGYNSGVKIHPVGEKAPNGLGLYDMSGNVWEWCSDWYGEEYYKQFENEGARNPKGPETGKGLVIRGGSWYFDLRSCRVADRNWGSSSNQSDNVGFRLARY